MFEWPLSLRCLHVVEEPDDDADIQRTNRDENVKDRDCPKCMPRTECLKALDTFGKLSKTSILTWCIQTYTHQIANL